MGNNKEASQEGVEAIDIVAGSAAGGGVAFAVGAELGAIQKFDMTLQGLDAAKEARQKFLAETQRPAVDTPQYKIWLEELKDAAESAKKPIAEKLQRLNRPLARTIEVFRNATQLQKVGMIGAILGIGMIVAASVGKIRRDWSRHQTGANDSEFGQDHTGKPDVRPPAIDSLDNHHENHDGRSNKSLGMSFRERESMRREKAAIPSQTR
jgi:hypothetical protein